ncbi:MAG: bifunctional phosphoribosylaminoimidazolecarboxamide formyltransferase/IMP cyclohydrolase [Phycisphaerales bacterium]|jgi:phosphoribosylaminoimidazolecarboxamide formyltransferase / IMP cyclohydrolase|nr:bifunctional phosphoribosylaminoimidazolecarboxamide formyltransferase/IMP cyclohydrolase [Phycisphaerales bacterium]MBT7171069.1 bifunctional phosphoribosylaminoimidazolecarboxamide formyltransferase/IMP cyclohydrolase [Phycisphaerales bacterium]
MDQVKVRRALLSVFDKTGIEDFARKLHAQGVELISSGGTAKVIEAAGIPVRYVQEWTGFPEMLGHRVVTLHPKVHGAILATRDDADHQADIEKYDLELLDIVCVSLYPFEDVIAKPDAQLAEAVEMIDIGGPTMVRGAAKNHRYVTVVTDPCQYDELLGEMAATDGHTSFALRQKFARQAFSLTAAYDTAISTYLAGEMGETFPERISFSYQKQAELRYGENPHQSAAFYASSQAANEGCIGSAKLLGGREISYNNYFDANGALELVKEFPEPAVAIIKHANPAGCAIDTDLVEAYRKAYFGDVNAAMGGIVAVNRPVTCELASAIVETYARWGKDRGAGGYFAEIVVAPSFDDGAVEIIQARKGWGPNVRLLETGDLAGARNAEFAQKYIVGGMLVQNRDLVGLNTDDWDVVSERQPSEAELRDLKFAWLCCKHVKSNAIVLAKDETLLGAGAGQMSRVNSAFLAGKLAGCYGGAQDNADTAGCVLASDAFFPFPDSLDWAKDAGATAVIQPGGAKKDQDVIDYANKLGLTMIFTRTRHFNH